MKTLILTALGLVLAAGLSYPQEPAGGMSTGSPDAAKGDEELDKAAAKAGAMTNYSCTITIRKEGMEGEGQDLQPVELQIQAGAPWLLKSGTLEAYRKGEALAVKEGTAWKRLEPSDGGDKAAQMLRMVRGPHEALKLLTTVSFKQVKREDSEGGRCFSGELTDAALKQLVHGKRGGDKPQGPSTGTAKVWINGEGAVTKYEIQVESKTRDKENKEIAVKKTIMVEIRDIGSTKYDVPPEVTKALEG